MRRISKEEFLRYADGLPQPIQEKEKYVRFVASYIQKMLGSRAKSVEYDMVSGKVNVEFKLWVFIDGVGMAETLVSYWLDGTIDGWLEAIERAKVVSLKLDSHEANEYQRRANARMNMQPEG